MLCVTNMLLHGIEDPSFVRHDNTLARPYISYTPSDRVDIVLTNPPFGGTEEDGIESQLPDSTSRPARRPTCSWRSSSACSSPAAAPPWCCPTARCSAKA